MPLFSHMPNDWKHIFGTYIDSTDPDQMLLTTVWSGSMLFAETEVYQLKGYLYNENAKIYQTPLNMKMDSLIWKCVIKIRVKM